MRRIMLFGSAMAVALFASCGGSQPAPQTAATAPSSSEFCDAKASFDALPGDTPDASALEAYQRSARPLLEGMEEAAPGDVRSAVETLKSSILDPTSLDEAAQASMDPGTGEAREALSVWVHERCGFATATVVATDNRFTSVPEGLQAGRVSLLVRNEGEAGHAVVLFRVRDGVTDDARTIVTGDPEANAEFTNATFASPGTSSGVVLDLKPGRYVFFDDEHIEEMYGEFTVKSKEEGT